MPEEFSTVARPHVEAQLQPGESLHGVIAATHQKTFSGSLYAIGVTDSRLVLLPLDRRIQPKGEARSITRDTLRSAKLDGAGEGWWTAPNAVFDATSLVLKLQTAGGEKLKLRMMQGGSGMLGALGGGEGQREGVVALAAWWERNLS